MFFFKLNFIIKKWTISDHFVFFWLKNKSKRRLICIHGNIKWKKEKLTLPNENQQEFHYKTLNYMLVP